MMSETTSTLLPGTRVRTDAGLLGTLERLEQLNASEAPATLLVRTLDNQHWYRFPLPLVHALGKETEQSVVYTVVFLSVAADDLDRFLLAEDGMRPAVGAAPPDASTLSGTGTVAARIPLLAEQLVAQVRPIQRGIVRVHTSVETTEQVLRVPVSHEEVIVEHIPADQYDAATPADPEETVIPVLEEQLVVETRQVVVEYLRVRKRTVTQQQEVRGPVRRERVTVSELDADGRATDTTLLQTSSEP